MMNRRLLFVVGMVVQAFVLMACSGVNSWVRQEASSARISIEVEHKTLFGSGHKHKVASALEQELLETRSGVPVQGGSADLVLRVQVTDTSMLQITGWDWQLIDGSGAVVMSKRGTSLMGTDAAGVARDVVLGMASVDTNAYAAGRQRSAPVAVVAPVAQVVQAPGADFAAEFPRSMTAGESSWAVVIGIEQYREGLPAASGAEADAKAFAAFAQQTLNVPERNIRLLLGERASKADILAILTEWLPRNVREPGNRVYVYFSGHGAPDVESGMSFLVPYDGNPAYLRSTALSVADLHKSLEVLQGQEVYAFLDSCFSGVGERSVLAEGTRPLVPVQKLGVSASVATFSASGPRETTGAHAASGHGLFTHYLLEGLKGTADRNGDGHVSIRELETYVGEQVQLEARRQNREQTPSFDVPAGVDSQAVLVEGIVWD